MRATFAVFLACVFTTVASPQPSPQAASPISVVTFNYENDKLLPSHYCLVIRENGTGTYESRDGIATGAVAGQGQPFQQEISVSTPLLQTIFSTAHQHKFFALSCEANNGGKIAFQGKKTLAYEGPDGSGSCDFNFSKIKQIQQVNDSLQSIASTLEAGHRLAVEHQHDRLSLDAELGSLEESVAEGHSLELQNIRPVLEEIASDPAVLNRARQRAAILAAGGKH